MATRSQLPNFINWSMKVTLDDKRSIVGTFLSFDRHMNIVLANACETRLVGGAGSTNEIKRPLGLIILRGENILSISVEAPPLPKPKVPVLKVEQGRSVAVPGPRTAPLALASAMPPPPLAMPPPPPIPGLLPPPPQQ